MHQAVNRKGTSTTLLQAPTNPKYRNGVLDQIGKVVGKEETIKFLPRDTLAVDNMLDKATDTF